MPAHPFDATLRPVDAALARQLLADKQLSTDALNVAIAELSRLGGALHTQLVRLGLMNESVLRDIRAHLYGLPVVDFQAQRSDPVVHGLLAGALAREHGMMPVSLDARGHVHLAMDDPHALTALDQITAHLKNRGARGVQCALASASELRREIDRVYGERVSVEQLLRQSGATPPPVEPLLQAILQQAVDLEASDVHFEPYAFFLCIRMRVDGVLRQTSLLHASLWPALCVRLKVLAGMDIAESRAAQDGRFNAQVGIHAMDFRVACLPTAFGENVVLRLLESIKNTLPLHRMNLAKATQSMVERALLRPEGMVLVTGPTGSGKTTTLYSILSSVSTEGVNVMTLEDPIEYALPLIRQTQVNDKVTFADGIRALMRQDPDILLVGEIRDGDTAQMAFRAAMTGHQVFATLHANSPLQAIQRLQDLGVGASVIAGNLVAVVGQRLVRKLCGFCKVHDQPSESGKSNPPLSLYQVVGCKHCGGSGYRGRLPIMEVINVDETMDALIATQAPQAELLRYARAQGFVSLHDDGLRLVHAGETTAEELMRVVGPALTGQEAPSPNG